MLRGFRACQRTGSSQPLNTVRTYGPEQQCFYIGKRVLVVVKLPEDPEEGGGHESSLQCDDGSYVSGNKPATVVDWKVR